MPCKHILKIREIYNNAQAHSTYSRKKVYNGWLYKNNNINLQINECDRDFVMTIYNLCKMQIHSVVTECNCEGEGDIKWLRNRISELEGKTSNLESNSNTQLVLRRSAENSLSTVQSEKNSLQVEKRSLESRVSDLQSSNWSLQSANSSLETQLTQKDKDIEWGKRQLQQVRNDLVRFQNESNAKQNRIDDLTRQFTALQRV